VTPRVEGDTAVHTAIIDCAWAAGFIDGEGSIGIEMRPDRPGGRLVLTVVQKHPEPLERLHELFGGHLDWQRGSGPRGTDRWRWRAASGTAWFVLTMTRPYLTVKAAEADIALVYQRGQQQGRKTAADTTLIAHEALTAIKNREGVKPNVPVTA
jgi:hypothetical protein